MRRLRSPQAWIALAALPLGLAFAELAVRALRLHPEPLPERRGSVLRKLDDELRLFENSPGAVASIVYPGDPPRTVELSVNAQGFRGPLVELGKPEGVLRIACVGDSHTFGDGVGGADTWPAHLQRLLDARLAPRRVEVMNCGVNAYDTLQEVLWLESAVLPYAPDVVVLQYYVNDTAARRLPRTGEEPRDVWLELASPRRGGVIGWLRAHSRVAELVGDGVWRRRGLAEYSRLRLELYSDASPGWLRVKDALRRARDELAKRDIAFGVALYPFLLRQGGQLSSHDAFGRVRGFCESERIVCLDAEPAFDGVEDFDALRVSAHDYHGNGEAHAIFARAVEAWLAQEGWLDQR